MNVELSSPPTGFAFDSRFLKHDTGFGHPECPARLSRTMEYLNKQHWFAALTPVASSPADLDWIHKIHSDRYIRHARDVCSSGVAYLDSSDVGVCRDSYDIALLAAGTPLAIADAVMNNSISNGFALLRPPGHHAEINMAMGFCLFNNVAVLARYLQQQYGIDQVLILDWDVHHGNGTQHSFEEDPSILYISTHQYPFYPGTGSAAETGIGRGAGSVLNCPMPAGSTDEDYAREFNDKIIPKITTFQPDFIIISAGFDAHREDPLAQICLTTEFFGWMTQRLMELAERCCGGRIISVLEGGYNLDVLPLCIEQHLLKLSRQG
jgi:acetoin utilization deacetylase AcuC-like enzyme